MTLSPKSVSGLGHTIGRVVVNTASPVPGTTSVPLPERVMVYSIPCLVSLVRVTCLVHQ